MKEGTLENTPRRSEFRWKIAVTIKLASAVNKQRLKEWNKFLRLTVQWEAQPQNSTIN